MAKLVLAASVLVRKAETGKVKFVTIVTIRLAGKIVASKTLGGNYTAEQALAEFRRNVRGWTPGAGQSETSLAFLAKVA